MKKTFYDGTFYTNKQYFIALDYKQRFAGFIASETIQELERKVERLTRAGYKIYSPKEARKRKAKALSIQRARAAATNPTTATTPPRYEYYLDLLNR